MQVRFIESEMPDGQRRLVVQAGGIETEIVGYGSGNYQLTLRPCRDPEGEDNRERLERFRRENPQATNSAWWGIALVWAEPRTIANLVYEVVTGQ